MRRIVQPCYNPAQRRPIDQPRQQLVRPAVPHHQVVGKTQLRPNRDEPYQYPQSPRQDRNFATLQNRRKRGRVRAGAGWVRVG